MAKKTAASRKAGKGTQRAYHHGDLRASLVTTAVAMLATRPPDQLSLRALAEAAGVSQSAPYRHFRDKDALLAAISQQGFDLKGAYMEAAIHAAGHDYREMFYGIGDAYFRMGLEHPQHFRLMLTSPVQPSPEHPELLRAASATFALLVAVVSACQRAGIIGAGDPLARSMYCWSFVNGFTTLYAEGRLTWLGVSAKNARAMLRAHITQYILGAAHDAKEPSPALFTTSESAVYRLPLEEAVRAVCQRIASLTPPSTSR